MLSEILLKVRIQIIQTTALKVKGMGSVTAQYFLFFEAV